MGGADWVSRSRSRDVEVRGSHPSKTAKGVAPSVVVVSGSPQNPHSAVVKMRDGKDGAPGFLPKAARNGAPEERRSEWMRVGSAESAREIPRPAGESAGLRDDVNEGWEKISFAEKVA